MELTHGGDAVGFEMRYGRPPVDFSASLNPLGMPAAVREAAREAIADSVAYPDPLCRKLTTALAARLGTPAERLFCGNGAAEVIHRLIAATRPRRIMTTAPTFAEYERAALTVGSIVERHVLAHDNGFDLEADILPKITSGLDILFLCQPNNPTGRLAEPELMRAILERTAAMGVRLFVDECFLHFVPGRRDYSLLGEVERRPNLFILDSFTKIFGMAGIRLGFGVSGDRRLLEDMARAGPPWTVSTAAQAAGIAALGETEFAEKSAELVRREKTRLVAGLKSLGIRVIGDAANYVFFHSSAIDLNERLAEEGILIRDCANFPGLAKGYFRIAVRREPENGLLLAAMARALEAADG